MRENSIRNGKGRGAILVAALLALAPAVEAQFHAKKTEENGQASVAARPPTSPQMHADALAETLREAGANYSGADVVMPEGKRDELAKWNPRLGGMAQREIEVWARLIHHSDGSYTESIEDDRNNSLEQITKSANGTVLQRRMVRLDRYGRAAEVLIRDGRGDFKYRGLLVYDQFGRFSEEQLFDSEGTLIRRKVQEYTSNGLKKPVRSWDYVENVPEDLKLVITRQSEDPTANQAGQAKGEKRGLFGRERGDGTTGSAGAVAGNQGQERPASSASGEKRKGLGLGRLFGSGRK